MTVNRLIHYPTQGRCLVSPRDADTPGSEVGVDELEFINAINTYKRTHGKPFPTWCEVLLVLRSLGYSKTAKATKGRSPRNHKTPEP